MQHDFRYMLIDHKKYRYRLTRDYVHELGFLTPENLSNGWATVLPNRCLVVKAGYCWNGADWFPELPSIRRATLVHDALCQLAALGQVRRIDADQELQRVCLADGIPVLLAKLIYAAVRLYAVIK